ncbi:MAG: KamA family radical SAM protein, partial [Leptospira sp.]|nr:KamA family radical SAM protein [Leptospira sp.]
PITRAESTAYNCAVFCRFCTRKRKVSHPFQTPKREDWNKALDYFRETKSLREVILSGGDPFSLADSHLDFILTELRKIRHLKSIRIHSRHPVTLPMRFTEELCQILGKKFPLTLVTHFNHPKECTAEAREAIRKIRVLGHATVLNQSVLLKGINDSVATLEELNYELVSMGVKPYYLHQCDEVFGISKFQVPIVDGLKIYQGLRGRISGIAVPLYVADLKGGGGKIPLIPEYLVEVKENTLIFRNYKGDLYEISNGYPTHHHAI